MPPMGTDTAQMIAQAHFEVAHGIGPGEVDPAVDDETGHYHSEDEKRHGDGLRAGDDHRSSIRAFMASGSEQPTIHAS